MKKFFSKKRNVVIVVVLCVALLSGGVAGWFFFRPGASNDEEVYVSSVATITGLSANGLNNRYAGVVESQESWSVTADSNLTIEETFVEVGQEVEVGTPLFSYDITETENSLRSAKIELERMNNELTALKNTMDELTKSRDAATDEGVRAEYNIELQQKQLDYTSQQYAISSKNEEIKKLEETAKKGVVTSKIAGVVKSISNTNDYYSYDSSNSYITVVNMDKFQIKGSINEQNLSSIYQDAPVIVYSRKDETKHWKGTITKIDANSAKSNSTEGSEDSMTSSSKYPFYISLEDTTGLVMGQHVYIEMDYGQLEGEKEGIWLEEYYIDQTDPENPCVWVDKNGRIAKQSVTLGEYNTDTFKYEIKDGLELTDLIAMPYPELKEGQKTVNMDEESGGIYEDVDGDLSPGEPGFSEEEYPAVEETEEFTEENTEAIEENTEE